MTSLTMMKIWKISRKKQKTDCGKYPGCAADAENAVRPRYFPARGYESSTPGTAVDVGADNKRIKRTGGNEKGRCGVNGCD